MRWLVTGGNGMLGNEVARMLIEDTDDDVTVTGRFTLNITHASDVFDAVRGVDVVINCAAWTDVDGAERNEPAANAVNAYGAANLAESCHMRGAVLLHVSSDYVVSGTPWEPIPEDAPYEPLNAYGRSKHLGELAVREYAPDHGYVVRTAWLYGQYGRNFVDTMLRLAENTTGELTPITVVDDQHGQPTWTRALATRLISLGRSAYREDVAPGIFHGTASGRATWYTLARKVFELSGHDPERVVPVSTREYGSPTVRPAWSVLGHDTWGFTPMGPMAPWEVMLAGYLRTTDDLY
jgi:dTDP-4-dehydrorhamnose reductase